MSDGRLAVETESFACGCWRRFDETVAVVSRDFAVTDRRSTVVSAVRVLLPPDRAPVDADVCSGRFAVRTDLIDVSVALLDTTAEFGRAAGGTTFLDGNDFGADNGLPLITTVFVPGDSVTFSDRNRLESFFVMDCCGEFV